MLPGTTPIPSRLPATSRTMLPSGAEWKSKSSMSRGVLLCVFLFPFGALLAQTLPPSNPLGQNTPADHELLRRLEADYLRAEIEDDATIAASILADDYVGLRPDGSSTNKSEVLNRLDQHMRKRDPYLITATD